jgi:hypothetical protein
MIGIETAEVNGQQAVSVTIGEAISLVSAELLVPRSTILSADKSKAASEARALACWLVRRWTSLSYEKLGRRIARDSSSVRAAVRGVEKRRAESESFAEFTDRLAAMAPNVESRRRVPSARKAQRSDDTPPPSGRWHRVVVRAGRRVAAGRGQKYVECFAGPAGDFARFEVIRAVRSECPEIPRVVLDELVMEMLA